MISAYIKNILHPLSLPAVATGVVLLSGSLPAAAQFDQNIAVEGKYVPEIIRIDRINSFPRRERFALNSEPLNFDAKGVPAAFEPRLIPQPATGWRASRDLSRYRGYVDLTMGSWLNTDLSAGYRFVDTGNTVFGARLQHTSTSLWEPEVNDLMKDTKQWRYDETIGLYASHHFSGTGRLDASAEYHFGYFNYYGWNGGNAAFLPASAAGNADPASMLKAPEQKLNDFSARLLWQSESRADDITWHVGAGVRYFGYNECPWVSGAYATSADSQLSMELPAWSEMTGTKETDINLNAGFLFPTSVKSAFGIDLDADILLYSGGMKGDAPAESSLLTNYGRIDNYGFISLTPFYRFSKRNLNIRLGLDFDIAVDAGPKGDRFSTLHVAPDVALDFNAGAVQMYLHLLGGSRLHTLASGYELDLYQQPVLSSTLPVYSPLDGSLGFSFGPFAGFSAGVDFAFRVVKNQHLGGWYQALLNYGNMTMPGLPDVSAYPGMSYHYLYADMNYLNMHGYSVGFNMKYDLGKVFSIEGKASYQPQKDETGYFNGYDRPRWTILAKAVTNPWKTLRFELSYEYRGVRNIYIGALGEEASSGFYTLEDAALRLPDLCLLNFGASYGITDRITVRLQADNLLNRHDPVLPCLPTQGVRIAAGVSYLF